MSRSRRDYPSLTREIVDSPNARWMAVNEFLRACRQLRPLRTKLALLTERARLDAEVTAKVIDELEEAGTDLRAEMLDQVVRWAFDQGYRAGSAKVRN
jgi:hypothetical protein